MLARGVRGNKSDTIMIGETAFSCVLSISSVFGLEPGSLAMLYLSAA
jgi:hypothetical protein